MLETQFLLRMSLFLCHINAQISAKLEIRLLYVIRVFSKHGVQFGFVVESIELG